MNKLTQKIAALEKERVETAIRHENSMELLRKRANQLEVEVKIHQELSKRAKKEAEKACSELRTVLAVFKIPRLANMYLKLMKEREGAL